MRNISQDRREYLLFVIYLFVYLVWSFYLGFFFLILRGLFSFFFNFGFLKIYFWYFIFLLFLCFRRKSRFRYFIVIDLGYIQISSHWEWYQLILAVIFIIIITTETLPYTEYSPSQLIDMCFNLCECFCDKTEFGLYNREFTQVLLSEL